MSISFVRATKISGTSPSSRYLQHTSSYVAVGSHPNGYQLIPLFQWHQTQVVVEMDWVEVVHTPEMCWLRAQFKRAELEPDISKITRDCSSAVFQRSTLLPSCALHSRLAGVG